ncbi:MAG: hypothetical protein ACE5FY_06980, partial [Nitrospiria bacterium]
MKKSKLLILSAVFIAFAVLFANLQSASAYILSGEEWMGNKARIPLWVSTSLDDNNIPYDGSFAQGITAIQNAIDEWNIEGNSEFQFYYAGTTTIDTAADDGYNVILFLDGPCPVG